MTRIEDENMYPDSLEGLVDSGLGLKAVAGKTWSIYRLQGWAFTRALFLPVGLMALGLYGCLVLCLLLMDVATQPANIAWTSQNQTLVLAALAGICCLTVLVFFSGGWRYLVYWLSLCLNTREFLSGRTPDLKGAYRQVLTTKKMPLIIWVSILCLLPCLPLAAIFGLPLLAVLFPQAFGGLLPVLMGVGVLLGLVLGVGAILGQLLLTYGFQLLALEAQVPTNPLPALAYSALLTIRRPWLTVGLQITLWILTSYLIPMPLTALLRFARLLTPLDDLHAWVIERLSENWSGAIQAWQDAGMLPEQSSMLLKQFFGEGAGQALSLAQGLTDVVVGIDITLLLLPLGTIAFTLVYLALKGEPATGLGAQSFNRIQAYFGPKSPQREAG